MTLCRLILVADDYAISPAVSAGIRALAEQGRLSGTGVMASMPHWPAAAAALRDLRGRVGVGLHVTLTDQAPLGAMKRLAPNGRLPTVGRLLALSLMGAVPVIEVRDEFERQLDCFERHFGTAPDFIDGHQHVHVLPEIWPVIQAAFGRRLDPNRCWLRDCHDAGWWRRGDRVKSAGVSLLARAASNAARAAGLRSNRGFSGFYDYGAGKLADFFVPMLSGAGDGHLLMVHPGHVDDALCAVDSLTAPRQAEWAFLASPDFPRQLADLGFTLALPGFPVDPAPDQGHIDAL